MILRGRGGRALVEHSGGTASGELPGELRESRPESFQTVVRRAPRQLSGELPDSCPEGFPTVVRRASGQLSGGLPDSCAESFRTAVRTAVRKASGKLSGEVPDRSGRFQGKSLETDLAKCLDRESNPGSSQAEPSVAPAAPQRPPGAGPARARLENETGILSKFSASPAENPCGEKVRRLIFAKKN